MPRARPGRYFCKNRGPCNISTGSGCTALGCFVHKDFVLQSQKEKSEAEINRLLAENDALRAAAGKLAQRWAEAGRDKECAAELVEAFAKAFVGEG